MTNGEKIQTILDVDRDCTEVHGDNGTMTFTVTSDFWNAEYKEPNKSEIPTGSTTKNDLVVDCISRKQAIRELKESAEHHANDSREEALLRRDRDIIKALPPVTPQEPRWIPCSEKLPEKSGGYLVTVCYDLLGRGTVREVRKNFFRILSKKWLYEGDEVTAWMALPKPYREVEE